jgi:formylglycine-generating enzyme required for sulfatase activity
MPSQPANIQFAPLPHLDMVFVEGTARFMMGSNKYDDEQPIHPVSVTPFWMGKYPVTQELWTFIMGANPAYFRGASRPVEKVSWNDICGEGGFLDQLNSHADIKAWLKKEGKENYQFRLPSEAEWEYAARGGKRADAYLYAGSDYVDEVAWYDGNSHDETKPVGLKAPNALGLYDMNGNVWEWCTDDWHDSYKKAPADSRPWLDKPRATARVMRGGGWGARAAFCRVAHRNHDHPVVRSRHIGLRLVLSPV